MPNTKSRAEWITGSIIIVIVTAALMGLYSGAQGFDAALEGAIGGVFALVGVLVWLAVSRIRG